MGINLALKITSILNPDLPVVAVSKRASGPFSNFLDNTMGLLVPISVLSSK